MDTAGVCAFRLVNIKKTLNLRQDILEWSGFVAISDNGIAVHRVA